MINIIKLVGNTFSYTLIKPNKQKLMDQHRKTSFKASQKNEESKSLTV